MTPLPVAKRRSQGLTGPLRRTLTKTLVRDLEPQEREYTVWDTDPKRLGLRVLPSGTKVYVLRIRQDGRQRWISIGKHGDPWTPDTAREKARDLLGIAARGDDPTRPRVDARTIPLVQGLSEEYVSQHVEVHLRPGSQEMALLSIRRHILPAFGKVRVDRLTQDEVRQWHASKKATPVAANRALVTLHGMMKLAIEKGYRPDQSNPAKGIRHFKERQRVCVLSQAEVERLARALVDAEGKEHRNVLGAFKLIMLTGCRQGEVFSLKWDEVDLERGELRLEDSKTGARVVYLNEAAQDVLANLPRVEGNPYVVPGWKKGTYYKGEQKAWERVREAAGLPKLRLHDLRHHYASVLASGGASLQMIGELLGHRRVATTQRYAHLMDSALRDLTERAATALEPVTKPRERGSVAPFKRKARP